MPNFCVNRNAQPNGDHEVHDLSVNAYCPRLPDSANRLALGEHTTCYGAVQVAKNHYNQVNGCYRCARACHTG